MREFRRHIRVGLISLKKDRAAMFCFWVLAIHAAFALCYATFSILTN